eukprot:SM000179S03424  [mRNA]  locus=s179:212840:217911:- [translate_table: standard]
MTCTKATLCCPWQWHDGHHPLGVAQEEEDFYVRYHTVQLLTLLLSSCPGRYSTHSLPQLPKVDSKMTMNGCQHHRSRMFLKQSASCIQIQCGCPSVQEAILATPQGVTRLMDMMLEREVIRNETLLLLINLTRSAEEIQKIVVFEGAFDRLFNIMREEGSADGGIIVQDSIELLNNLVRGNSSNQVYLRETIGLHHIPALLKLRKGSGKAVSRQKAANLLCGLETVALLLAPSTSVERGKDTNVIANQTLLVQNKLLEVLLAIAMEEGVVSLAVRSQARDIGDLVMHHTANRDILGSAVVGEEPHQEAALQRVLKVALQAQDAQEAAAAEHVIKCFCQDNPEGQSMVASTLAPLQIRPPSSAPTYSTDTKTDVLPASFGSLLLQALRGSDGRIDLVVGCRAAAILSHILSGNKDCKERVLSIPLEVPSSRLAPPELLLPQIMRHLAAVSPGGVDAWLQPVLLRLLTIWLADCPRAVSAFLEQPQHLPYLVELTGSSGSQASIHVAGLAAVLIGTCVIFNESDAAGATDAATVVDIINQRVGLSTYFGRWQDMRDSSLFSSASSGPRLPQPLTRATAAAAAAGDQRASQVTSPDVEPLVTTFYDAEFIQLITELEEKVRARMVELFARPRGGFAHGDPVELSLKDGETQEAYALRLKTLLQKQAHELQDLRDRNAALAENLLVGSRGEDKEHEGGASEDERSLRRGLLHNSELSAAHAEAEALRQQLSAADQAAQAAREEQLILQSEVDKFRQLALKHEADLQGLSDAYNTLEQHNFRLESELKDQTLASQSPSQGDLEAAREEARAESEAELNDLLVCLGQEESKVEKLRARLEELGEDVETLLDSIAERGNDRETDQVADEDGPEEAS